MRLIAATAGMTPETALRRHADRIPGARLMTFPELGHLLFWEDPDGFADAVTSFLLDRAGGLGPIASISGTFGRYLASGGRATIQHAR